MNESKTDVQTFTEWLEEAGWRNIKRESYPQNATIEVYAISRNGRHSVSGMFSYASGYLIAGFLRYEPNGDWSNMRRMQIKARRTDMIKLAQLVNDYV